MKPVTAETVLSALPSGLRDPLLSEFNIIIAYFLEHKWGPSELSGGRFSEIVYSILKGHAEGTYPSAPSKPPNFVDACRRLEQNTGVPRSFQILIPRLLPGLYEIRNNRNVGHVGGDVDPDFMDSSAVVSISSWILSELIRVFHDTTTEDAQRIVDDISERRFPLVWKRGDIRRVLKPDLPLQDLIILLLSSTSGETSIDNLFLWTDYKNKSHFKLTIKRLHSKRLIEFTEHKSVVELLPPGLEKASELTSKYSK